jgi:hypothetical protein
MILYGAKMLATIATIVIGMIGTVLALSALMFMGATFLNLLILNSLIYDTLNYSGACITIHEL